MTFLVEVLLEHHKVGTIMHSKMTFTHQISLVSLVSTQENSLDVLVLNQSSIFGLAWIQFKSKNEIHSVVIQNPSFSSFNVNSS